MENEFPSDDSCTSFRQFDFLHSHFKRTFSHCVFVLLVFMTEKDKKLKSGEKDKSAIIIAGTVIPVILVIAITIAIILYKKVR